MSQRPVLLLGASGQLGRAWQRSGAVVAVPGPQHGGPDLPSALSALLARYRPSAVVNTAAYTAVDSAQSADQATSYALNVDLPWQLAQWAYAHDAAVLHFSSDYVFGGATVAPLARPVPIDEAASTAPVNRYGVHKALGERAILDSGAQALVLRTSWLYSRYGANFFNTISRLLHSRCHVPVVCDQWGVPTSVDFVLRYGQLLWQQGQRGVWHVVPSGQASWFELAVAIQRYWQWRGHCVGRIYPVSTATFYAMTDRPLAPRPAYSVLSNQRLSHYLGEPLPHWTAVLSKAVFRWA